jgi:hypothetical protein
MCGGGLGDRPTLRSRQKQVTRIGTSAQARAMSTRCQACDNHGTRIAGRRAGHAVRRLLHHQDPF